MGGDPSSLVKGVGRMSWKALDETDDLCRCSAGVDNGVVYSLIDDSLGDTGADDGSIGDSRVVNSGCDDCIADKSVDRR